jgi:mannitol-1-/sugar-/sorbitol-6-phosphatase
VGSPLRPGARKVHPVVHGRRAHDTVAALLPADVHGQALEEINRLEMEGAEHVTAIPGAPELIRALAGQPWSVVTSATRALAGARLAAAGIAAPQVLVSADDVARGKPAPDGYRLAAERLGHAPARCAVIEDATSGVAAARGAAVGVVVGVGERALETDADAVVADLTALRYDPAARVLLLPDARLR